MQRTCGLLLLALLVLCMPLGQADKGAVVTTITPTAQHPAASNVSPLCGSPLLLFLTLALAVAFFLRLR